MPATTLAAGFTPEAFESFLAARPQPEWLIARRRAAFATFNEMPLPDSSEEEWRRTDLRVFRLNKFAAPAVDGAAATLPPPLLSHGVQLAGQFVTQNSRVVSERLDPAIAAQGVLWGSLEKFAAERPELVEPRLMTQAVNPTYDKFAALHAAFWAGGLFLYVPRGVRIAQPLHALTALAEGGVDLGHVLIVLEEGAEATVLFETGGDASEALHCGAIEILQGPNSKLRFVSLQDWGHKVWHFAHQHAVLDRGSRLQWTIGALGARLAKVNQHVSLRGKDAEAQVNGVMFTEGKQHLAYHTRQTHEAPFCRSDLLYEGALQDKSQLVWRGMIKVAPGAQKTDAYQRNDNLLLSTAARADSIPGLEIQADDVRCTHGATAGRVDDELIFYCQARGLTRQEAVRTVVAGFFQKVFDRITIESVREALTEAIGRRVQELSAPV